MSAPAPKIKLAWLGVISGAGAERGQTYMLRAETVIGRKDGDWILAGDLTISSQHVRIRLEPPEGAPEGAPEGTPGGAPEGAESDSSNDVFILYDLASANGTYVGSKENYQDESSRVYRRELRNGDYILIGETTLVYLEA